MKHVLIQLQWGFQYRTFEYLKHLNTKHFEGLMSNGSHFVQNHSKIGPFHNQPTFNHTKSELARFSDPHCTVKIRTPDAVFITKLLLVGYSGPICRNFSMILKINLAPIFLSKNWSMILSKNSAYYPWSPLSHLVPNLVPSNLIKKTWFKPVPNQF